MVLDYLILFLQKIRKILYTCLFFIQLELAKIELKNTLDFKKMLQLEEFVFLNIERSELHRKIIL